MPNPTHTNIIAASIILAAGLASVVAQPAPTATPTPIPASERRVVDPTTAPRRVWRPVWRSTLPFTPQAVLVDRGIMYLARRTDQGIEVSSAALDGQGRPTPLTAAEWPAPKLAALANGEPLPAGDVIALSDRWAILDRTAATLALLDPQMTVVESMVRELPLAEIDGIVAANGRVVLGGLDRSGQSRVAAAFLPLVVDDGATSWTLTQPLPEVRRGAAYFAAPTRVYTMGGRVEQGGDEPFNPPLMMTHALQGEARDRGWAALPFPLRPAPGRSQGVQVDPFFGVMGEHRVVADDDQPASPTLAYTLDRSQRAGAVDPWRAVHLDLPTLDRPLLAASPLHAQMIVVGDQANRGQVTPRAWGFLSSMIGPQDHPNEAYFKTLEERAEARRLRFAPYAETLETAKRSGAFHVVAFLGDDQASNQVREQLTRDANAIIMMRGILLSSPWPEDVEAARERTGLVTTPAFALLDADGNVVGRKEGAILKAEAMRSFLAPALGPAAVTPTPQATTAPAP